MRGDGFDDFFWPTIDLGGDGKNMKGEEPWLGAAIVLDYPCAHGRIP